MTVTPAWQAELDRLINSELDLAAGAELLVAEGDGTEVFRAPLARMWRLEGEHPRIVWIRPVLGGYQDYPGGPWRFALSAARRRSLAFRTVTVAGGNIDFDLVNDQRARIRPVRADLQARLERWDTFVLAQLPADVEADLDALAEDSWHGDWA